LDVALATWETRAETTVYRLDVYRLAQRVVEDATQNQGEVFGIVNVDTPIFVGFADSPGANPADSFFADDLHISAVAHRLLGDAAFAAVPEPATGLLMLAGLMGLPALARTCIGKPRR
jgi:outer membrane lipase/esterase